MNKITIVVIFLAVALIIFGIVRTVKSNSETSQPENNNEWPDPYYMDRIGKFCPTGWVYEGKVGHKDICKNVYDIPTQDNTFCHEDKIKKFPHFRKKWQDCIDNPEKCGRMRKKRCEWINRCGINDDNNAQWIGFEQQCSSVRPIIPSGCPST